ncbi:DUF4232 domain-containing protein [Kitasatospora sp. NBC_01560]|uniref:hypothetical protein n=1 Tax=Kitasatospora sp. NBC_01560 TaxID=2975965 RepID=UPI003864E697
MRTRRLALTAAAVAVLAATATACGPDNADAGSTAAGPATTTAVPAGGAAPTAPNAAPTSAAPGGAAPTGAAPTQPATAPKSSAPSSPAADKSGPGQACGANDLVLGTKSESQAGGYILISAKAKPGITCTLPAGHPTIAFGSGGIEAAGAEQSAGEPITLSGTKVAYAGVMTKTTKDNKAIEFTDVIVAIGKADPNPAGLPVGPTPVDKPIVTNWHTLAKDAVPGI